MTGASLSFLGFSAIVIVLANLSRHFAWRQAVLLAASAVFLWECAEGEPLFLLIGFVTYGYIALKLVESRRMRAAVPVVLSLLVFVWLKKYAFVPRPLLLTSLYSTLGLSYILFRVIHLLVEAENGTLPGRVGVASYLTYLLNFTTLLAGPIQRYQDFDKEQRTAERPTAIRAGQAVERIIIGLFKAIVLGLIFDIVKTGAANQIDTAPDWLHRVWAGAVLIASCPFLLYCNFSGYIDVVIGVAALVGFALPENFDRPFSATSFIAFWGRWHITLSSWLKTYVYNPLLMTLMRRFPAENLAVFWGVLSFFATFFLVGAWHGQTSAFLFFGMLQGSGMALNKLYEIVLIARMGRKRVKVLDTNALYIAVCRGLTFTWFAFTLIWFWFDWAQVTHLASAMGIGAIAGSVLLTFILATLGLAFWEKARAALLNIKFRQQSILRSHYTRTAWATALGSIDLVAMVILGQHVPEIVYKAF